MSKEKIYQNDKLKYVLPECMHYIGIDIYHSDVVLIVCNKEEVHDLLLKAKYSHKCALSVANCLNDDLDMGGCYIYTKEDGVFNRFIWFNHIPKTIFDYSCLAHEVEHCVFHILDSIGVEHTMESDEAYAYLTGYIFGNIDKWVNDYRDEHEE